MYKKKKSVLHAVRCCGCHAAAHALVSAAVSHLCGFELVCRAESTNLPQQMFSASTSFKAFNRVYVRCACNQKLGRVHVCHDYYLAVWALNHDQPAPGKACRYHKACRAKRDLTQSLQSELLRLRLLLLVLLLMLLFLLPLMQGW